MQRRSAFERLTGSMSSPRGRRALCALAPLALLIALSGLPGCTKGDLVDQVMPYDHDAIKARKDVEKELDEKQFQQLQHLTDSHEGGSGGGGSGGRSDIRLKRDIVELGRLDNGIHLYRFRYKWADEEYVGVMAQEVEKVVPSAVSRDADGYLRVDYGRLGLRLETWDEWLREHAKQAAERRLR
jgi:hypothetical protein